MEKTYKQKNIKFSAKNNLLRLTSVFLVFLLGFGFLKISSVYAYFDSNVSSVNSTFEAGTLDVASSNTDLGVIDLGTDQNYSVINQGSLSFNYEVNSSLGSGSDADFCNQLNIVVTKGADTLYSGVLPSLSIAGSLASSGQDDLVFNVTDPSASGTGKTCNFNFVSKAWQPELGITQGFTDQESSATTVYSNNTVPPVSSGVVLNEFLPYPNGVKYGHDFGNDSSDIPQGEWVELYNNSDTPVDLTGWYIRDSLDSSSHKIMIDTDHTGLATQTIAPHGFLVVYMNKALFNNSSGDSVRLFDNNDNLIDSHSYTLPADYCNLKPTEGNTNDETGSGVGTGCKSSVPDNKSYARIPDGTGDWVDPIPTPGQSNELGLDTNTTSTEPGQTLNADTTDTDTADATDSQSEFISSTPNTSEDTSSDDSTSDTSTQSQDIVNSSTSSSDSTINAQAGDNDPSSVGDVTTTDKVQSDTSDNSQDSEINSDSNNPGDTSVSTAGDDATSVDNSDSSTDDTGGGSSDTTSSNDGSSNGDQTSVSASDTSSTDVSNDSSPSSDSSDSSSNNSGSDSNSSDGDSSPSEGTN